MVAFQLGEGRAPWAYGGRVMLATSMKIGLCLSLQRTLAYEDMVRSIYEDRVSYAYEDRVTSFSTKNTHSTTAAFKGNAVLYMIEIFQRFILKV